MEQSFGENKIREGEPGAGTCFFLFRPLRLGMGLLRREGEGIYVESRKNEFGCSYGAS